MKWYENILFRVKNLGEGLKKSVVQFPLEALLGLAFFVVALVEGVNHDEVTFMEDYFVWFFPLYVILFCVHRFGTETLKGKLAYALTFLACLSVILWGKMGDPEKFKILNPWVFACLYFVSLCLLFVGKTRKDDSSLALDVTHYCVGIFKSILVGTVVLGLCSLIILSIDALFEVEIFDDVIFYLAYFIYLVATPLLCCWYCSEQTPGEPSKLFRLLVDYVLSPALAIYAVILFLYIAKIVVKWELPQGGVAYMAGTFLTLSLLCRLLRAPIKDSHFDWFFKYFTYIAVAPLVLLWIGTLRRVGEYGITQPRFYLLAFTIMLTVYVVMLAKDSKKSFQPMMVTFVSVMMLFTFIPGISARNIGIYCQKARLDSLIEQIKVDGVIPDRIDDPNGELAHKVDQIKSAAEYLKDFMLKDKYEKTAAYGLDLPRYFDDLSSMKKHKSASCESEIDLGEYTIVMPEDSYSHRFIDAVLTVTRAEDGKDIMVIDMEDSMRKYVKGEISENELLVHASGEYKVIINELRIGYLTNPESYSIDSAWKIQLYRKPVK